MDTYVSATIAGKAHDLQFHDARVLQELFQPCRIDLSLGFGRLDAASVYDRAVSSWLGERLTLVVADRQNTEIATSYEGIITGLELKEDALVLHAFSEDVLLTANRRHRSFVNKSLFDVASDIIKGALEGAQVTAPQQSLAFRFLHQYAEDDHTFLRRLAMRDGSVFFHDGTHFVYDAKLGGTKDVDLGLEEVSGVHLGCHLGNLRYRGAPYDFVKHTDPKDLEVMSGAPAPAGHPFAQTLLQKSQQLFKSPREVVDEPFLKRSDFERYIKNRQAGAAGTQLRLGGTTNNPLVAIGRAVSCADHALLKDPFVVTRLDARFENNVYSADFQAAAKGSVVSWNEDPRDRAAGGLQPAVVTDNKDPENLGRVQIRLLWDGEGAGLAWARTLETGAGTSGTSYGTHFTPRVGDQVLVGFEHNNASFPIVLGALYTSETKPDFVTTNGTEEVLVMKTPRESTIRMLEKDGAEEIVIAMKDNKNLIRLEMKGPKITIESEALIQLHAKKIELNADDTIVLKSKDLEISTSDDITTKAGGKMSTSVANDLSVTVNGASKEEVTRDKKLSAAKVGVAAQTELKLEAAKVDLNASGMMESKAGGISVIKGSIVQIN